MKEFCSKKKLDNKSLSDKFWSNIAKITEKSIKQPLSPLRKNETNRHSKSA